MLKKTSDNKLSINLTEVLPTPAHSFDTPFTEELRVFRPPHWDKPVVIHDNFHPFPTALQCSILQHRRFLVMLDVVYTYFLVVT